MKKLLLTFALCLGLVGATAAQDMDGGKTTFGLGVSLGSSAMPFTSSLLNDIDSFQLTFPSFYVPIVFSGKFRFEPEFGILRLSASDDTGDASVTGFVLGTGAFATTRKGNTSLYYGARVAILVTRLDLPWLEDPESKTDFRIGPAAGGEYLFGDHLGLGGELGINYTSWGDFDENSDISVSTIVTSSLFFIRWYF